MARARRREPEPRPNSLIASAVRIRTVTGQPTPGVPRGSSQKWQEDGWYFLDTCGELSFAASWYANALSRVRLYIQRSTAAEGQVEVEVGPAVEALSALTGGPAGVATLMYSFGMHLFTPGECYLVGESQPLDGDDVWTVLSTDEIRQATGTTTKWEIDRGDGDKRTIDTAENAAEQSMVIRIWRSHPRLWVEATSPVRAVLPVLRELEQLTKHVGAAIDSRLAGAGILLLPSEMTFGTPQVVMPDGGGPPLDAPAEDPNNDPFVVSLTEAMVTPIKNRDNASAVVPIVVRAPGALIGNAKHITFSTPLDEKAMDLRSECIRRLALGLDMPPEVLLGTADVNHWGAWQIDEAALKTHIEPACELICNALTLRYLYPVLEGEGQPYDDLQITFDTSDLRLRPNRTNEAFQLYDRLGIDLDALLRETGFEEGDIPDEAEQQRALLIKVATSTATPELAAAALSALGVPLTPAPATTDAAPSGATGTPAEPPPAPETAPENRTGPPEQQAAALLAAAWPLVFRAVERANNRVNNRAKVRKPIPQDRMADALRDAFPADVVDRCAALCGVAPDPFRKAMERYATITLATGRDLDPVELARLLTPCLDVPSLRVISG